jgi:hypothetical protein
MFAKVMALPCASDRNRVVFGNIILGFLFVLLLSLICLHSDTPLVSAHDIARHLRIISLLRLSHQLNHRCSLNSMWVTFCLTVVGHEQ